jgi:hypothetical protein
MTKRPPTSETPETAPPEAVRTAGPAAVESLDDLAGLARTLDTPPGAPVVDPQAAADAERRTREAQVAACARDFAELLEVARESLAPLLEEGGVLKPGQVAAIWDDKALKRIAYPLAVLAQRHGLNADAVMEQYGPWLLLAAGIGLPGFATFKAIKANRQAPAPAAPAA